ncbi:MAG: flagellar regulator YcgR PilZN domain-containing protein, partial [Gammaproteobacteria bacterium]
MLDKLRQLFGDHRDENLPVQSDNPNFITDRDRIHNLIRSVEHSSQLCLVMIKGSKRVYSTSIIEFQPDQGYLLIDEITPEEGNGLFRAVGSLKLSAHLNGVHLAFKLDLVERGIKQGSAYYR